MKKEDMIAVEGKENQFRTKIFKFGRVSCYDKWIAIGAKSE